MALDLKAWLKDMGVKDDAVEAVLPALTDAAPNIERATLRQSDYSKQMDDLRAKQTALDAANDRVNQELIDIAALRNEGGQVTEEMRNSLAKAQGEVTRLSTILTTKAAELGLDPKTIIGEPAPPAPPRTGGDPPPNLEGYVRVDDLNQRVGQMGNFMLDLTAMLPVIQHEHHQLTGEFLDATTIINEFKSRAADPANRNRDGSFKKPADVRKIWEESFDIPAKRAAKSEATQSQLIKDAEQRGYERARTESTLPGETPVGRHSVVLRQAGAEGRAPKATNVGGSPAGRSNRISSAATALATHRYANGKQPPA
jgi:hypothetical protein